MIKRKKENNLSNLPHDGKRKKAVVKQTHSTRLWIGGFEKIRAAVSF